MRVTWYLLAATTLLSSALAQNPWGATVSEAAVWGATAVTSWGQSPTSTFGQAVSTDASTITSPSGSQCTWHGDHYDCAATEEEAESGSSTCVIHVGHTHGDCTAEELANCDTTPIADYNKALHIGSIFIILITSAVGVFIPLVSGRTKAGGESAAAQRDVDAQTGQGRGVLGNVFFIAKHFGTGIILATAFIHLLYHGFIMFANQCVGQLAYEATAPAIALAAAFVTFVLDFLGHRHMAKHQHGRRSSTTSSDDLEKRPHESIAVDPAPVKGQERNAYLDLGHDHHAHLATNADKKWQVLLLEAGILFHSIMIGVTLGATGGNGWTTLLIVIVFHQFFEGLALGARIALLPFAQAWKPWVMGLAFILITPLGIAIGVGVHSGFAANGPTALLSVGILNSISAGILLYAAFDLLSKDWTSGALRDAPLSRVAIALCALTAGMVCMSVLGMWA